MIPFYWIRSPVKNGEETRKRMIEAYSSTILEEIIGLQVGEWA
jgi:hypothetical protein